MLDRTDRTLGGGSGLRKAIERVSKQRRAVGFIKNERRTEDGTKEMGVADHHDRLGGGVLDLLSTWKGRCVCVSGRGAWHADVLLLSHARCLRHT